MLFDLYVVDSSSSVLLVSVHTRRIDAFFINNPLHINQSQRKSSDSELSRKRLQQRRTQAKQIQKTKYYFESIIMGLDNPAGRNRGGASCWLLVVEEQRALRIIIILCLQTIRFQQPIYLGNSLREQEDLLSTLDTTTTYQFRSSESSCVECECTPR